MLIVQYNTIKITLALLACLVIKLVNNVLVLRKLNVVNVINKLTFKNNSARINVMIMDFTKIIFIVRNVIKIVKLVMVV